MWTEQNSIKYVYNFLFAGRLICDSLNAMQCNAMLCVPGAWCLVPWSVCLVHGAGVPGAVQYLVRNAIQQEIFHFIYLLKYILMMVSVRFVHRFTVHRWYSIFPSAWIDLHRFDFLTLLNIVLLPIFQVICSVILNNIPYNDLIYRHQKIFGFCVHQTMDRYNI